MKKPLKLVSTGKGRKQLALFDERPIELAGWRLSYRRATPIGTPTIDETQNALHLAEASDDSSPFWIADIVSYVSQQTAWGEKATQITATTGYATQTAYNLSSMMRRVAQEERELAQSIEHAKIVAKLPKDEQRKWLKQSATAEWTTRELGLQLKASRRRRITDGQAELSGMFRVWYVDCPWKYGQAQPSGVSAQTHYPGMTIAELTALGPVVQAHTMKDAVGFFWVTAPFLYWEDEHGQGPSDVIRSWGFEPKTGMVWDKVEHRYGHYVSVRHEHLIIATRGSCTPDRPVPMPDSVVTERPKDDSEHSEKPEMFRTIIEQLYDGPYVEMFARKRVEGWTTYGNQILEEVAS